MAKPEKGLRVFQPEQHVCRGGDEKGPDMLEELMKVFVCLESRIAGGGGPAEPTAPELGSEPWWRPAV